MRRPVLVIALAMLAACRAAPAGAVELRPLWTLPGLEDPESVALSADGKSFYVANVAGEGDAADGRGFISRVSRDGTLLQREWITGLDAPKGAIVVGDRLYVSDITRLVEIDVPGSRVAARYPAPGATFLNDVAVAPDGTILVADSGGARIYALKNGRMSPWAEDPALRAINGLLPEANRLVITTMAGKLLAMDYKTRAVTLLAEGIGNGDGVAALRGGRYLVSEWPGRMFLVDANGALTVLTDSRKAETYINDFIRVGDDLIVPNWKPGLLSAYRIVGETP